MTINSWQKKWLLLLVILIIVTIIIIIAAKNNRTADNGSLIGKTAVVYRSASCGCCANYIAYLRRAGARVEEKLTENTAAIRKQFGVSDQIASCHTARIDGYTVEGHMPIEAIEKLLTEKPNLIGIALPLMPAGSPGMPGRKNEPFNISGIKPDGSSFSYLSL